MAYALDNSKRKFHRLLDSISNNGSNTSLVSTTSAKVSTASLETLPVEKKRRLGGTALTSTVRLTSATNEGSIRSPTAKSSSITRVTPTNPQPTQVLPSTATQLDQIALELRFCPGDRNQLLKRIQSFHGQTSIDWRIKPIRINEVAWARRGWKLIAKETVGCVSCRKTFNVPYHKEEAEAREIEAHDGEGEELHNAFLTNLEERCREMIVKAHFDSCPWTSRGCDEMLYRVPFIYPSFEIERLGLRYRSICEVVRDLPTELELAEDFDTERAFKQFDILCFKSTKYPEKPEPPPIEHLGTQEQVVRIKVFTLAMLGWEPDGSRPDTLRCGLCFRRIGLWLFRPRLNTDGSERAATMSSLNPSDQHYSHCPWINPETQSPGKTVAVAGWDALASAVKNAYEAQLGDSTDESSGREQFKKANSDVNGDKKRFARVLELKKVFSIKKKR